MPSPTSDIDSIAGQQDEFFESEKGHHDGSSPASATLQNFEGGIYSLKGSAVCVGDTETVDSEADHLSNHPRGVEQRQPEFRQHPEHLAISIPVIQQIKTVLFPQWLTFNYLLLTSPIGITLFVIHVKPTPAFIFNFLPIIPLTSIIIFAADQLRLRLGLVLGSFIVVTASNLPQLIASGLLLKQGQISVLRLSLVGSILSNMLFLLGLGFFVGGLQRKEQYFNSVSGKTLGNLLLFAVIALMIPTASTWGKVALNPLDANSLSRAIAVILILIYIAQLFFVHKSHTKVWIAPALKVEKRDQKEKRKGDTFKALALVGRSASAIAGLEAGMCVQHEHPETPKLSLGGSLLILILATILLGFHTEFTTSNLSGLMKDTQISQYFIGLTLFPAFSLDPGCMSAANKDQQDLNINIILPRCIQIAVLIIPVLTLTGWALGSDNFSLVFDDFELVLLTVSVYLTYGVIAKGRSDWFDGLLLMLFWIKIGLAAWFYPTHLNPISNSFLAGGNFTV